MIIYVEAALSERSHHGQFHKLRNVEFDVEEHTGRTNLYEDVALEELLVENSCQMQEEHALTLGLTQ